MPEQIQAQTMGGVHYYSNVIPTYSKKVKGYWPNDCLPVASTSQLSKDKLDPLQFTYEAKRVKDAFVTLLDTVTKSLAYSYSLVLILFMDFFSAFRTVNLDYPTGQPNTGAMDKNASCRIGHNM